MFNNVKDNVILINVFSIGNTLENVLPSVKFVI